jgi:drug/metabolite transporter (DMT)-like permease
MRRVLSKVPGQVFLWLAVLIFGASSSVTRKLTQIGAMQFVDGHNPISFCNVLFAGNLCALAVMLLLYRHQLTAGNLKSITRSQWIYLMIVALLSGAIIPAAVFQALALAPVNTIILLGRLELPLVLIASTVIFKEPLNRYRYMAAGVVLLGIAVSVLGSQSTSSSFAIKLGTGEILTVISTVLATISGIVNKQKLTQLPLGIIHVVRTGCGTIIFFVVANVLYGAGHFGDIFSPFLWKWMLVYGGIIVVLGQSFWAKGFRQSPIAVSAIVACFNPITGMAFAYWILAEVPTGSQLLGCGILMIGLLMNSTIGRDRPEPIAPLEGVSQR